MIQLSTLPPEGLGSVYQLSCLLMNQGLTHYTVRSQLGTPGAI